GPGDLAAGLRGADGGVRLAVAVGSGGGAGGAVDAGDPPIAQGRAYAAIGVGNHQRAGHGGATLDPYRNAAALAVLGADSADAGPARLGHGAVFPPGAPDRGQGLGTGRIRGAVAAVYRRRDHRDLYHRRTDRQDRHIAADAIVSGAILAGV